MFGLDSSSSSSDQDEGPSGYVEELSNKLETIRSTHGVVLPSTLKATPVIPRMPNRGLSRPPLVNLRHQLSVRDNSEELRTIRESLQTLMESHLQLWEKAGGAREARVSSEATSTLPPPLNPEPVPDNGPRLPAIEEWTEFDPLASERVRQRTEGLAPSRPRGQDQNLMAHTPACGNFQPPAHSTPVFSRRGCSMENGLTPPSGRTGSAMPGLPHAPPPNEMGGHMNYDPHMAPGW